MLLLMTTMIMMVASPFPSSSLFIFGFYFETGSYHVLAQVAFNSRQSSNLSLPPLQWDCKHGPPQLARESLNSLSPYCAALQRLGRGTVCEQGQPSPPCPR